MIKKKKINPASGTRNIMLSMVSRFIHPLLIALIILLSALLQPQPALAVPLKDSSHPVPAAAMKLVQFCVDPKVGLDNQAVATLVNYVLGPKSDKEADLPRLREAPGAYYEFDTRIDFASFLQYSYNSQIPSALTSPASLRYSLWTGFPGELQKMPGNWKLPVPAGKPVVIYGLQHDGITPDVNTGVYYEYDLKRTLILLNHKGRQVLISVSKQIDISSIGKKGFILGNDNDWNYYYSGIPGSAKAGLGWVKSYIYDYFSVAVFVESGSLPCMVRSGFFQWIRAGWSGMNFVQSSHIIAGMKRNAHNSKTILESPRLPALSQITSTCQYLSSLPRNNLAERYNVLQQARQSLAVQSGKIGTKEMDKHDSAANAPKEQIIEELMVEYLKIALGKSSLMGKKSRFGY